MNLDGITIIACYDIDDKTKPIIVGANELAEFRISDFSEIAVINQLNGEYLIECIQNIGGLDIKISYYSIEVSNEDKLSIEIIETNLEAVKKFAGTWKEDYIQNTSNKEEDYNETEEIKEEFLEQNEEEVYVDRSLEPDTVISTRS